MLLKLFRWFFGYVSFRVKGGFLEVFLNSVNEKGINLWDLKKSGGSLYAKVFASDYKLLRHSSRKSNSRIKIIKKYGLPILMHKYKKRAGIIIGSIFFLITIQVFSLYIWNVKIEGNKNISSEEIVSVMKDFGVGVGTRKSAVDSAIIKQLVMTRLTDISWISVNINGSCLNVSVKEKIKSPEIIKDEKPCNIIAKSEGQVERMEVYKGVACVNQGDAVIKGQTLISGNFTDESGNTESSHAEGKIFAKTTRKITEKVKLRELFAADSGKVVKKYKLNVFGTEIPINFWKKIDEEYRVESYSSEMNIFGIKFPVVLNTDFCYYQNCGEKFLSPEEASKILEDKISDREKNEFKNVKIISKSTNNYQDDNEYISEAIYVCLEDIAEKQEVLNQ